MKGIVSHHDIEVNINVLKNYSLGNKGIRIKNIL